MHFAGSIRARSAIAAIGLAAAVAGPAHAGVISSSPTLPLLGVPYSSPIGHCFGAAGVCVTSGMFEMTSVVSSTFTGTGQDIVADAIDDITLTNLSDMFLGTVTLTGTVEQLVLGRTNPFELGTWTTDLISLDLQGAVLGHTLSLTLASSPESSGTTSIVYLNPNSPFKRFEINSFFDVFVDLSLEGTGLTASLGPVSVSAVPEPSTWAMMLIGFAGLGFAASRSRKGAQPAA